ncbi:DUF6519 domain-containing protein [Candidatus Binatia bacterium]|nr:DUF6519 domain-containing protein [Candidatus Binatia bacterium]
MGNEFEFRPTHGELRGDFSRDTFDPSQHFLRVLMQQGRVQVDADWNEQVSILLHYLQTLAKDLIGPHGGPKGDDLGFEIKKLDGGSKNFGIGKGRYYVDGVLCENAQEPLYTGQKGFPFPDSAAELQDGNSYLVYLDVWERHITHLQDDRRIEEGSIREVALGLHGPDTATRSQVVWQVKVLPAQKGTWEAELKKLSDRPKPMLKAQAHVDRKSTDPCTTQPEMRYHGAGNQLYRVEIHTSGSAGTATFKWSRENGSVVFPIVEPVTGNTVTLAHFGRDDRLGLKQGDWVEIVDDDYVLQNRAESLLRVERIDRDLRQVTLSGGSQSTVGQDLAKHPQLRRWDHQAARKSADGALPVKESEGEHVWLTIEDGVQIQFPKPEKGKEYKYRTGDYWLIPARTATGDVEWPRDENRTPVALPPHGIDHHYAPLWLVSVTKGGVTADAKDELRCKFEASAK